MADGGTLVVTGGSGTVGRAVLRALAGRWRGPVLAIGRRSPTGATVDRFLEADLQDGQAVERACEELAVLQPPIAGLLLAAGVDCRSSLESATHQDYWHVLTVNCLAHLHLLAAGVPGDAGGDGPEVRAVVVSSDVVGSSQPGTIVYAAAKAALDTAVRHAAADRRQLRILLLRLPDLGIPMTDVRGQRPAVHGSASPALGRASRAASEFLLSPDRQDRVKVWTDA